MVLVSLIRLRAAALALLFLTPLVSFFSASVLPLARLPFFVLLKRGPTSILAVFRGHSQSLC
jgi:hypothetical protein